MMIEIVQVYKLSSERHDKKYSNCEEKGWKSRKKG